MKKTILFGMCILFFFVLAMQGFAYELTSFTDGPNGTIYFNTGDLIEDKTLELPRQSTIHDFTINVSGTLYEYYCQQINATTSESCGESSGSYTFNSGFNDDNYSSYTNYDDLINQSFIYDVPSDKTNKSYIEVSHYKGYCGPYQIVPCLELENVSLASCMAENDTQLNFSFETRTSVYEDPKLGNCTVTHHGLYCNNQSIVTHDYDACNIDLGIQTEGYELYDVYAEERIYWESDELLENLSIFVNNTVVFTNNSVNLTEQGIIDLNITILEECLVSQDECEVSFVGGKIGAINFTDLYVNYTAENAAYLEMTPLSWSETTFDDAEISKTFTASNSGNYAANNCTFFSTSLLNQFIEVHPTPFNLSIGEEKNVEVTIRNPAAIGYDEYLNLQCTDASINNAEINTNDDARLLIISTTRQAGGGGFLIENKKECNIIVEPNPARVATGEITEIVVKNGEEYTYTPDISISGQDAKHIEFINALSTMLPEETKSFGIKPSSLPSENFTGEGLVILSSQNCADIIIPVYINAKGPSRLQGLWYDFSFENFVELLKLSAFKDNQKMKSWVPWWTYGISLLIAGLFALLLSLLSIRSSFKKAKNKEFDALYFSVTLFLLLVLTTIFWVILSLGLEVLP